MSPQLLTADLLDTSNAVVEDPAMVPGPFPLDALSPVMQAIAKSVAEVYQIPTAMPGMSALAVGAGAGGKTYKLTGAVNGQSSYANLYVIASAGRGEGKGSVAAVIAGPLIKASIDLGRDFLPTRAKRNAEVDVLL